MIAFSCSRVGHSGEAARRDDMGTIIKFPAAAAARRLGVSLGDVSVSTATILILPVIRIERTPDDSTGPKEGAAPGRRRKRRARS